MWNAISLVQDLNSCCRVHFLRRAPLFANYTCLFYLDMCKRIADVDLLVFLLNEKKSLVSTLFQYKITVLFQTIQVSISTEFSSIWPIDISLSGAITPGQSGPGSNGNEGVLCITQHSSITGTSSLDFLVSYPGQSLAAGSYSSAEKQSEYSTNPADKGILKQNWLVPM